MPFSVGKLDAIKVYETLPRLSSHVGLLAKADANGDGTVVAGEFNKFVNGRDLSVSYPSKDKVTVSVVYSTGSKVFDGVGLTAGAGLLGGGLWAMAGAGGANHAGRFILGILGAAAALGGAVVAGASLLSMLDNMSNNFTFYHIAP